MKNLFHIFIIAIISLFLSGESNGEVRESVLECKSTSTIDEIIHDIRYYHIIPQHNLSMEERNSQLRNKRKGTIEELAFAVHEEINDYVLILSASYDIEETSDGRFYYGASATLPFSINVDKDNLTITITYIKNNNEVEEEFFNCQIPEGRDDSNTDWELYFYFIQSVYPDYLKDNFINKISGQLNN